MNLLSIIIPAYNEPSLGRILDKILKVNFSVATEIIVVDDGSTDGTREWIQENATRLGVKSIALIKNRGKGAALCEGLKIAEGNVIVVQDADLEYDPQDIVSVVMPVFGGKTKACYGSRYLDAAQHAKNRSFVWKKGPAYCMAYLGGRAVTGFCNLLFRSKLTDEPTCYKAFDANFLRSLGPRSGGFELEPEITAKTLKRTSILEVPIKYHPRTYEEGKKIGWKDGFLALWTLLKYRFVG